MDPLAQKFKMIVVHIVQSSLPEKDKDSLLGMIFDEISESLEPILLTFMPKDELERLSKDKNAVSEDSVMRMYAAAMNNPTCHEETNRLISEILSDYERILREKMIIV